VKTGRWLKDQAQFNPDEQLTDDRCANKTSFKAKYGVVSPRRQKESDSVDDSASEKTRELR